MSGMDSWRSSGPDRGDGRGDRDEDRPFPGAPRDRPPAPPLPEDTLSMDDIMADPVLYEKMMEDMRAALAARKDSSDSSDSATTADASDQVAAEQPFPATPSENEPGDKGVLMHAHSEFHGEKLDLYTDGTRWRSGEALDAAQKTDPTAGRQGIADVPGMWDQGSNVIGERPDDESELPVSAEGMLEADEGESKLDRLRNKTVRNLSDAVDSSQNQADALRNILNTPPTAHAEVLARPDIGPAVDASPHASPTVDAVTQMAVVTLLVGYQVSGWAHRKADEIRRRNDGSPG